MLDTPVPGDHDAIGVADFSVAVHPQRSQVVVAPAGELDLATVGQVERELGDLRMAGFHDVVLDLRAITFIDSSGLRLLLTEARRAEAARDRFRLIDGSVACRRLLEITGTREAFEFVDGDRP